MHLINSSFCIQPTHRVTMLISTLIVNAPDVCTDAHQYKRSSRFDGDGQFIFESAALNRMLIVN